MFNISGVSIHSNRTDSEDWDMQRSPSTQELLFDTNDVSECNKTINKVSGL